MPVLENAIGGTEMCTHIFLSRANMMNKKQIYHTNFSSFCLCYLSPPPPTLLFFLLFLSFLSILFLLLSSSDTKWISITTDLGKYLWESDNFLYIQSLVVWQLRKLLLKSQLKVRLWPIEQKWADGKEAERQQFS